MSNRVVVKLCDQCEEHWVPRAVVAISEDRQWLVVLDPEPEDWDEMHFNLFHFSRRWWTWEHELLINDTGQHAHEVLREFLEGRDEQTPAD